MFLIVFLALVFYVSGFSVPNVYANEVDIQPSSQDSEIRAHEPEDNRGSEQWFYVGPLSGSSGPYRALVQFNLGSIPAGSDVLSAYLGIYTDVSPNYQRTNWAYRVIESWVETSVTWNTRDGSTSWTTPGGSYTTTDGASALTPGYSYSWVILDVTDIVRAWIVDGEPNYGFLIKDGDETANPTMDGSYYRSKEHSSSSHHPVLKIVYNQFTAVGGETPVIDGTISTGEWNDAFNREVSASTAPYTVYTKVDGSYLFVAFQVLDSTVSSDDYTSIYLDVNHDGHINGALETDDFNLVIYRNGNGAEYIGGSWTLTSVSDWIYASSDSGSSYSTEYRIDYSKIGVTPDAYKILGFGIERYDSVSGLSVWFSGFVSLDESTWGDLVPEYPFYVPWFTNLPMVLLASVAVMLWLRRKRV
jgi:hypothetical protein